jgi:23S rRNA (guanine745-N1)-methyltransferase
MRVGPTSGHLMELREVLYDEVRPYADDKHLALVPEAWPTPTVKPSSSA